MNLLLINYEFPPVGGGAANATWEIARALVQLGHRPVVLTARFRNRRPSDVPAGVTLIEVPALRRRREACTPFEMATFAASASLRIRGILRRERIDGMIAFFSIPCGPIAWWGARGTGVPYVVSLRGGDVPGTEPSLNTIHRIVLPLRHIVMRQARSIVANSAGLRSMSEKNDPFPVEVIPNGVDSEFFRPPSIKHPPAPFRILFVGRFQAQKNLAWLLEQLALIPPDYGRSYELHMVGDGPLREELRRQAAERGIASIIVWHGWLDHPTLRDLYQTSHCLVNPSLYEGMPNVVLEAVACGLAVIASDVPGNRELLEPGEVGELFQLSDGLKFRDLLLQRLTLRVPPALHPACVRRFTETHSWRRVAARYATLFLPDHGISADIVKCAEQPDREPENRAQRSSNQLPACPHSLHCPSLRAK